MNILVIGSGMMGRAIIYDLCKHSNFEKITIADKDIDTINSAKKLFKNQKVNYKTIDVKNNDQINSIFKEYDVIISAIPYHYNFILAKKAIENHAHFLDLGGNNDIVNQERRLFELAKKNNVTVIPDCGLAPGMVSIFAKDIVENLDDIDYIKLRVGGLPVKPFPPLNYQIVFSPYGLINEYVEDAIVLDNGEIKTKQSMTDIEKIEFPEPYGEMEAFLTSGGCSTLPYTYKKKVGYLDYKTIRYPGHCKKFKIFLDLGFADKKPIDINGKNVVPRDVFAQVLTKNLPVNQEDIVLIKVLGKGIKNNIQKKIDYTVIDKFDKQNNITAMMRTTAYPISIIAQMIEQKTISKSGVFCGEEIVPCKKFFTELEKRKINIVKKIL